MFIVAQELTESFSAWLEEKDIELRAEEGGNASIGIALHHSITYHCDVLTAGAWPISSTSAEFSLVLPPEVKAHLDLFTKFYTDRSSGRKLLWIHHLSYGSLQANCFDKRYEFALSFYQMMVVLLVCSAIYHITIIVCLNNLPSLCSVQQYERAILGYYFSANEYPNTGSGAPHPYPRQGICRTLAE